jgi:SAM-dependent methyltransferase
MPCGKQQVQDWFVRRENHAPPAPYWGRAVDPDGAVRDRLSEPERLQYIGDIWEELAFLRTLPVGAICDVGCGPGWLLRELGDEWFRVGVEIDAGAQAELRQHGISFTDALHKLAPGSFDVLVAYHVIEHLTDPILAINEMRDILKPGGWLVLGTPDFGSPCAVRFGANYRLLHDPTHVSLFTLESMHRFLREHMFSIRSVRFPFPARYATPANFARWADTSQVSPPWPGNFLTFLCQR